MSPSSPRGSGPTAADAPRPALAEVSGVSKRYGNTVALDRVDLTVRAGRSHALVGRNGAGKSTLVAVLTGLVKPDAGRVSFGGAPAPSPADRAGWQERVACVYQRPSVIPGLSVAENLFLNRQPRGRGRVISLRAMRREAASLLDAWEIAVDPDAPAGSLTVEARQMVEIARALAFGARFIVLDEPTADLDGREIRRLFGRMRALERAGVTFLFISHHLDEVYEVCQTVTVLRDARRTVTAPVAELSHTALVAAVTGDSTPAARTARRRGAATAPVRLGVRGLTGDGFRAVDLEVRRGEVVGLTGTSSSGKTRFAETLTGLRRPTAGDAWIDGGPLPFGDVPRALAAGVAFVPRDRHLQGLVEGMSVADNATMTVSHRLGRFGFVGPARRRAVARRLVERLDIRTEGPDQPVSDLSGGNQQKVVMARALAPEPLLLVLINPTSGVDVRSRESLLGHVDAAREEGTAVLLVSDEPADLRHCDRVVVLFRGRTAAEFAAGWSDQELIAAVEGVDNRA